jgi:hypothetical protein
MLVLLVLNAEELELSLKVLWVKAAVELVPLIRTLLAVKLLFPVPPLATPNVPVTPGVIFPPVSVADVVEERFV